MRNRPLTAAVLLLAGAVVNVAVAWRCAVRPWTDGYYTWSNGFKRLGTPPPGFLGYRYWTLTRLGRTGGTRIISWALPGMYHGPVGGPALSLVPSWCRITPRVPFPQDHHVIEDAYGWPMLSMSSAWQRAELGGIWRVLHAVELQAPGVPNGQMRALAVPLAAIWPGFAVNTLFYVALLATLWLLIRVGYFYVFHRVIRVRRGLCPKCCYPMGDSNVCTECGMTLPGRTEAVT